LAALLLRNIKMRFSWLQPHPTGIPLPETQGWLHERGENFLLDSQRNLAFSKMVFHFYTIFPAWEQRSCKFL
jgi:hypothetical protein